MLAGAVWSQGGGWARSATPDRRRTFEALVLASCRLAQPQARSAIEKLAGYLEVAGVGCGFLDHVQDHIADVGDLGTAVAALRSV